MVVIYAIGLATFSCWLLWCGFVFRLTFGHLEKKKREQDLLAQLYNKENFVRFRQPKTCIQFSCVVIKVNSAVLKMHSCTVSVRRPVQQPFDWPLGPKFFFPKPKCKSPSAQQQLRAGLFFFFPFSLGVRRWRLEPALSLVPLPPCPWVNLLFNG